MAAVDAKQCPFCTHEMDARAMVCPNCGREQPVIQAARNENPPDAGTGPKNRRMMMIAVVALGIGALVICAVCALLGPQLADVDPAANVFVAAGAGRAITRALRGTP
jgi:uncharacterized membrane protein YvbJ